MPNKRSKRKRVQHFFCPLCGMRLWRLGSTKYYLFYQNAAEIRQNLKISAKKASFLATQNSAYIDRNSWIEEFFCTEHGRIWLLLSRQSDGNIVYRPAKKEDWKQTNKTINPTKPNPSVSEFTYRMSRKVYYGYQA
ncbi:hypothetical protein IQ238_00520 [Pleurocapsales cyanobacterium LEGE 06147]|nr:hypothetical protein [Pleurocapsales cyanobacterium LEGE 06147]